MRIRIAKATTLVTVAVCCRLALGQAPPSILTIDTDNSTIYQADVSDATKWGTNPNPVPSAINANVADFFVETLLADIVAVNGQPAKGLYAARGATIKTSPNPAPGSAIADTTHNSIRQKIFEILKSDGTPVGTVIALGMSSGASPPGSPAAQVNGNWAIVGGTGAFLGARGQVGSGGSNNFRDASMAEDPANRRVFGGGKTRWLLTVIPMFTPQVLLSGNTPSIVHADRSLVTSANPAKAGETLTLFATGLGPTRPGVDPGHPFTTNPLQVANSPVQVLVNGKATDALYAAGFPGTMDQYWVDFQVPSATASGPASIQLSSAWIVGPAVQIPIQ